MIKLLKRNNGTPGLAIEIIKIGGIKLLEVIKTVFNACFSKGTTPSEWNNADIILLQKKVDITNFGWTKELTGFRPGYRVNDHLHV